MSIVKLTQFSPSQAQMWSRDPWTPWVSKDPELTERLVYLRLIDFVYHSSLGLRVMKKKKREVSDPAGVGQALLAAGDVDVAERRGSLTARSEHLFVAGKKRCSRPQRERESHGRNSLEKST